MQQVCYYMSGSAISKEVSSWFTNLKSVKLFALYSQQVCMNVTRIDPKFYIVVLVWLSRKWELQMVAWLSCAQKNCVLFKQLSPHLRVYSTYTLSLLLHTLTMILSTCQHHAYTHRWSCNTQAVSNFAKDWIEPIVDKFKLPVGIGELIDWQL